MSGFPPGMFERGGGSKMVGGGVSGGSHLINIDAVIICHSGIGNMIRNIGSMVSVRRDGISQTAVVMTSLPTTAT